MWNIDQYLNKQSKTSNEIGLVIGHNMGDIFQEKSYAKRLGDNIPRHFLNNQI